MDADEFRRFHDARVHALSRAAFYLTGDDADAQDLLQEALLQTLRKWKQTSRYGDPEAYVRAVMLNKVRSNWRSRLRALTKHSSAAALLDTPGFEDSVAIREALGSVLRLLPARQRAVLYLRYYEDLSERQVADLLGCSTGTVKRHAHDGLKRLRVIAPPLLAEDREASK